MRFILEFKMYKNKEFWDDVDTLVTQLIENPNFGPFWDFKDKYPNIIKDQDDPHDKILVPLHNRNSIRKRISFGQWMWMWMSFIGNIKEYYNNDEGFEYWINNTPVTLYRGIYSYYDDVKEDLELGLEPTDYKSFTFKKK